MIASRTLSGQQIEVLPIEDRRGDARLVEEHLADVEVAWAQRERSL